MSLALTLPSPPGNPPSRVLSARVVLSAGEPTAVRRFVVALRIAAVDLVVKAGPLAHVLKERFEGCVPSLAHRDALRSVLGVRPVVRVPAAVPHGQPGSVRRGLGPAVTVRRRLFPGVRRQLRPVFLTQLLSLVRRIHLGRVAGSVLADAVTTLIDDGVLTTPAGTQLRDQRGAVLLLPLRFADLLLRLFGVTETLSDHETSVSTSVGTYNKRHPAALYEGR